MRPIARLSTHRTTAPTPGRSRNTRAKIAPRGSAEAEHSVTPAAIGVALAWLAFFVIAIEQALTMTSYGEALQNVVMHLN